MRRREAERRLLRRWPGAYRAESLAEVGTWAACGLRRDGDHLVLEPDEGGDPTWCEQASAFYVGLGRWVQEGRVDVEGENDERWSYVYGPDGARQVGVNGWDGTDEDGEPTWAEAEDAEDTEDDVDDRRQTPTARASWLRRLFGG